MLSLRGRGRHSFHCQAAWAWNCLPACRADHLTARDANRVDSYHISCKHFLWLGFDYSCIFPNPVGQRYCLLHLSLSTNSWSVGTPSSMDVLHSLAPQNLSRAIPSSCLAFFSFLPQAIQAILSNSCVCVLVAQSCLTLCDPMDCSLPGFSVHGILQARLLEWAAIPFPGASSQHRDHTWVSYIAGGFFPIWTTREAH